MLHLEFLNRETPGAELTQITKLEIFLREPGFLAFALAQPSVTG